MGEKLVVGPFKKGLQNNVLPFLVDNDAFPTLINAYQWRGRIKRKRGTQLLNRLKRYFDSTSESYYTGAVVTLDGDGEANLLVSYGLQEGTIVPGSVVITGGAVYTDPGEDGILETGGNPAGTINYATSEISIPAEASANIESQFNYNPALPVMGLENLKLTPRQFKQTIAFDTRYAYFIQATSTYETYDISFYKNPTTGTYTNYVQKSVVTPTIWNGQDYMQFWTTNYEGAFWATNGIREPFVVTNYGMQYNAVTVVANIVNGPPSTVDFTIPSHGLQVGDFLFFNEFEDATIGGLNFQTGYVTTVTDPNTITVTFPEATFTGAGGAVTLGIAQYLTAQSDATKDCIRWYDGDPTSGSASLPVLNGAKGWVNFCPPLSRLDFSVSDLPADRYYLIGARMMVPFYDRLLFMGPVVQSSAPNSAIYLQDTFIWSQNGTPYYTASFDGDPTLVTTEFTPLLVPTDRTATPNAFWEDQTGFGGYLQSALDEPIVTAERNEDVYIVGYGNTTYAKLTYTGNDLLPFNLYVISSEYDSASTFGAIRMDKGVLTRGKEGFIITSQSDSDRFDLDIPDEVFKINLENNGNERFTAWRDYINEWIYFTYPYTSIKHKFNNATLFFNYRDHSWALFFECYTTYGQFYRQTGFTWATVGQTYKTWADWNVPWNSGNSNLLQPDVIAGNQQGFIIFKDSGTDEDISLYIQSFTDNVVTSPDHCLNNGDYIQLSGCLGTIGAIVNGQIFQVGSVTTDTFELLSDTIDDYTGTYFGEGYITRLYIPFIQTKQFPTSWSMGRKTRIGPQQYLLTTTDRAQITLQIYLSQNENSPYNTSPIVPNQDSTNTSLVNSSVLYTCPESTNLGLSTYTSNLQMPTATQQSQIWHRKNQSLIGDTVQLGFTLSDEQMKAVDDDGNFISQTAEIELHGFIMDLSPSMWLA